MLSEAFRIISGVMQINKASVEVSWRAEIIFRQQANWLLPCPAIILSNNK